MAYRDLVLGESMPVLKCLALKILLGRIQQSVRQDGSQENIEHHIAVLHAFFSHNEFLARKDMESIFKVGFDE